MKINWLNLCVLLFFAGYFCAVGYGVVALVRWMSFLIDWQNLLFLVVAFFTAFGLIIGFVGWLGVFND